MKTKASAASGSTAGFGSARFFKTRKLAADAISAGHVRLNNHKSRSGKTVKVWRSADN